MKLRKCFWLTVIVALQPFISVFAHPGHGHKEVNGHSVLHYLTEPTHLISFAVIVVLFVVGRFYFQKHQKRSKMDD